MTFLLIYVVVSALVLGAWVGVMKNRTFEEAGGFITVLLVLTQAASITILFVLALIQKGGCP